jgi:hypothetical protein
MQIDNLNELPKEKRPSEWMIWEGTSDEMESWIEKVLTGKQSPTANLVISEKDIEG